MMSVLEPHLNLPVTGLKLNAKELPLEISVILQLLIYQVLTGYEYPYPFHSPRCERSPYLVSVFQ